MHIASGNVLTVVIPIPVDMTAQETMLEEATRECATIVGFRHKSDPVVLTTNEQQKPRTKFEKGLLQLPPLAIKISTDYPVMLSQPPPHLPIQLRSLIVGLLTIGATIAAGSSHS